LVAEGKFDDAITQFKEVKRLTPNDIYPRMKLADIYDEQKKDAEWLEEVNGILEMNADEMAPYSMLQRHLLAKGEPEKYWDMILPYAKRGTAQDLPLQRLVEFAPQVKKLDEAVEIARARVNAAPTSKGAWLALAQGLQSQEKWTDAIDAYARASRLDPTNMTAIRSYALTAEDHGTKKQAVDAYKLYTDSYPTDAWGLLKYGNVLRADGQNGLALDIFRKVLERFPDNETAIKAVKELENSR
jgi:tetratricopeptide (TPR) repeat protein